MTSPQASLENNFIIDSHCHLDLIASKGLNIDEVIENASKNNVKILQTICTKISKIEDILYYANKYENVYASCGIHPNNVDEEPKIKAQEIIDICASNKKIIGIGETGLDYYYKDADITNQKNSFIQHIKASQSNDLPVIIHSRSCDDDMAEILQSEQKNKYFPALLHCFSSSKELARKALDLGIFISLSGIVTFSNAKDLQEIVKFLPLDFILLETDAPYLAPTPHRGQINQPSYTKFTAEFVANLKNVSLEEVANITTKNFFSLFKKITAI